MTKLEKYIFYIFIFLLPLTTRYIFAEWTGIFNEWTAGAIYGTDILLGLLFLLWLIRLFKTRDRTKLQTSDYVLFGFVLISGLSIINALIPAIAWFRLLRLTQFVFLYLYIRHNAQELIFNSKFLIVAIASGAFQALIGIGQSFKQGALGLEILGESPLVVGDSGIAVFNAGGELFMRAYGSTPHPNVVALFLMCALWAFYFWYLNNDYSVSSWKPLILYAMILLGFLLTFSRTIIGIWALAVLIGLIVFITRRHFRHRIVFVLKKLLILIVLTIVILGVFIIIYWPQVNARIHISRNEEAVTHRLLFAEMAGNITRQSPVLGVGIGQFVPKLMDQFEDDTAYMYQPVHNIYLLVLSEVGILGLAAFVIFLIMLIYRYIKSLNPFDAGGTILFVLLIGVLVVGVFDHFLFTIQQGSLMLWILFGIVGAKNV
ncbi:MAG: O-antigen ligase family protein [Parcubacteria group bacterium]